jgi:hypothetical protein
MPWQVIERKIGRAGGVKRHTARQPEWDQKYGVGSTRKPPTLPSFTLPLIAHQEL